MTAENETPENTTEERDEANPEPTATDAVEARGDQEAPAAEEVGSAPAEDSDDPAVEETDDHAGEEATDGEKVPERDPRIPEVITTRTLFFLAPDLPPLPERPARRQRDSDRDDEREEREERETDSQRDSGHGRGRSRRGSRSSRNNRGHDNQDRRSQRESQRDEDHQPEEKEQVDEPQKIHGSTRLAAKRQRRREGRESGRRRTTITESEFQARRESVDRKMLVRSKNNRVQLGVLEDNILVEHYVARNEDVSLIGNVYLGRVQNVLPSMEAAFVDIGGARNAVLYSGEVDWAASNLGANQPRKIENALKSGDRVLVQVTKDPVGHKGARLTSQVSLPGRYLVYVPGNTMNGISRKLPDTERNRLKKILKDVLPEGVGVIVRTAAEGATEEQLQRDVDRLTKQWQDIQNKAKSSNKAPQTLHAESDMLIKIVRDVFNEDFDQLIVQGQSELDSIKTYLGQVAPDLVERIERYSGEDIFTEYRVNDMIDKALSRKVWLPSGGSLVIDRTEAMTVVDVNTGKFVGTGGNLEETVTKNNLEAAEEIVRQLRLRDIGGIIVIDFIDMVLESNRDLVQRRLIEGLSRDRTKHQVAEVTSLGLVQMTRKKIGLGLLETFSENCTHCDGRGVIIHGEPVGHTHGGSQPNRKSGRGGRSRGKGSQKQQQQQENGQQQNGNGSGNGGSTHEITEDARNALTKIAASTIPTTGKSGDAASTAEIAKATEQLVKAVEGVAAGKPAAEILAAAESAGAANTGQDADRGAAKNGSGDGTSAGNGKSRNSRRSRRSRRVRTDAPDTTEQGGSDSDSRQHGSESGSGQRGSDEQAAEQRAPEHQRSGKQESGEQESGRQESRKQGSARQDERKTAPQDKAAPQDAEQVSTSAATDGGLKLDLPEARPAKAKAEAPKDPKAVAAVLESLDAALDSLGAGTDTEPTPETKAESTHDAEQKRHDKGAPESEPNRQSRPSAEPAQPQSEPDRPQDEPAKAEQTTSDRNQAERAKAEPDTSAADNASTGQGRKRGGRRRISTGPISTGE